MVVEQKGFTKEDIEKRLKERTSIVQQEVVRLEQASYQTVSSDLSFDQPGGAAWIKNHSGSSV